MHFEFFIRKKKRKIEVKLCKSITSKFIGLMLKKQSPPLLFVFGKEKIIKIHSLFCSPFVAVWLDKNKKAVKIEEINKPKFQISGRGMYLLEILETNNNYSKITN